MTKGAFFRRQVLATAILAAPFIAWLFGAEAALIVMALTLSAGSYLLAGALDATPRRIHRWLRLGIVVNLAFAAACGALAIWLLLR
ncbi:MAG: hypothetical protein K0S99_798 [Thermomicrobiales bacterium]|nr:hypothetical protein [Thermomicrobiales bacterium]MDF2758166.1 hypothetical protein [Thermomicrobiales bacterium]